MPSVTPTMSTLRRRCPTPSGHAGTAARATALERARDFLRASREEHALELAESSDSELLSRLDVVTPEGMLTNAGAVAFVGRAQPALD
jgi:ATP-dependent DNA helicase RecG